MSTEMQKLEDELATLAKAVAASEDDKVLAAAKEAGVVPPNPAKKDGDKGDHDEDDGIIPEDEEDDAMLGKSFSVVGDDGTPVKAYDATSLLKSLMGRVEGIETSAQGVAGDRESILKSVGSITSLLKAQAAQLETLKKSVAEIGGSGKGRQAVLSIAGKPDTAMIKSTQPEGLSGAEFMAKAMDAQKNGLLTGHQVAVAEASLNRGMPVPPGIVAIVAAGK